MDAVKEYGHDWWFGKIDEAEKRLKEDWWTSADQIVKKYKAKKNASGADSGAKLYLYNIFWANVGILKAALYARTPKPMVERIWHDMNDNVGRVAALMLQRCLAFDLMKNNSPMDAAFKKAVEDRLIPGLGCLWLRYESEMETVSVPVPPHPQTGEEQDPVQFEVVSHEEACTEYVHWRDIVYPSARTWDEVWFVARKIYMTPADFKKKFKKKIDKDANASAKDEDKILPKNFSKGKVTVYEIWCKRSNKVYWVCREVTGFCQEKPDFLELDDFYPCPQFLLSTHTTDDFLPRPDYTMVKDQYEQLNELNTRIVILEQALRVIGVYDKKNTNLQQLLTVGRENEMIPVEKWAMLADQGGLKGAVDWFPIEQVANVLKELVVQKASKLEEIYELTGISDIMRGATNPRETLGSQELKSQYSSVRLQYLQMEVSTFVRDALIIKAQIICKHFQDDTILKLSNIESTPDAQYAMQALQLLRDSQMSEYKIDINEEGLALPDYNQEKQTRIEFLTTVGQFLSQAAPITAAMPGALPYLVQIVRWVASGLRGSNEIQGILDQAINAMQQNPPQAAPQGPPPDPTKIQQEQVKQQAETQRVGLKFNADKQLNQQKADLELRNKKFELDHQPAVATHQTALTMAENQHQAGLDDALANSAGAIKKHLQDAQNISNAMVQEGHAQHEFVREQKLQAKDQIFQNQQARIAAQEAAEGQQGQ